MKKILIIILIALFVNACEVFTIKGKKIETQEVIEQTQSTPLGVVTLLINEFKNDNILAATEFLAKPDGSFYSASEKYEKSSELSRMKRFMDNLEVTGRSIDTVEENLSSVTLELNYTKKATFYTKKINDLYYIVKFNQD